MTHDAWVVLALGAVAVLLGNPLTVLVFRLVDRGSHHRSATQRQREDALEHPAFAPSLEAAGQTLRGGAWIGTLERLAVYAAVLTGHTDMVALTLAVKGLGRYPELRGGSNPGTAERFIIGTFTSVLWAAGAAGVAHWLIS